VGAKLRPTTRGSAHPNLLPCIVLHSIVTLLHDDGGGDGLELLRDVEGQVGTVTTTTVVVVVLGEAGASLTPIPSSWSSLTQNNGKAWQL